ncbi:MAG: hypothetical protein U0610_29135 [bacterium]
MTPATVAAEESGAASDRAHTSNVASGGGRQMSSAATLLSSAFEVLEGDDVRRAALSQEQVIASRAIC